MSEVPRQVEDIVGHREWTQAALDKATATFGGDFFAGAAGRSGIREYWNRNRDGGSMGPNGSIHSVEHSR